MQSERNDGSGEWKIFLFVSFFFLLFSGFILFLFIDGQGGINFGSDIKEVSVSSDGDRVQVKLDDDKDVKVAKIVFTDKRGGKYYYDVGDVDGEIEIEIDEVVSSESDISLDDFDDIEKVEVVYEDELNSSEDVEEGEDMVSTSSFQNFPMNSQQGVFSVEYNAIPNADNIDGLFLLSEGAGSAFNDYAILVRFSSSSGNIDVRNGDGYSADSVVAYRAGETYHFRVLVDVENKNYDVYVDGVRIADDYSFRTPQLNVNSLNNYGVISEIGSASFFDVEIRGVDVPDEEVDDEEEVPISICTPDCSGKTCGSNGCGGSCGSCSTGQICDSQGRCQVSAPSQGDYYVDISSGSDSNSGTESSPWRTIGHAEDVASAGDLVIVKPGDYTSEGVLVIRGSGTTGNKIVFKAEPSRQAKVQGFYTRGNNIRIEGFEITNDIQGYDADGIFIRSSNVDIVDNYIHDISATGIDSLGSANADNIYIANNYMNTVGAGMYINGDNWIVENNEIERLYLGSAGIDADYTRFFGNNHIIRNNYFHGSIENEVEPSHTDCFQTYNANNQVAHGIIIEGNICTGYYRQGVIANGVVGGLTNFTIRNNIFAGNGRNAWGISGRNVRDVTIVNNVISNFMHYGIGITEGADNAIVKNNILYNSGGNAILLEGTNAEHSYNIIFGGGRITPAGTNNIIGEDPLFVDVANYNFRLRSNSPARNAGTDTSEYGVTRDIDGVSRPQGSGYDIGVYEY